MIDRGKLAHDRAHPARREHQRIAAGEDDLPDAILGANVVERCFQLAR